MDVRFRFFCVVVLGLVLVWMTAVRAQSLAGQPEGRPLYKVKGLSADGKLNFRADPGLDADIFEKIPYNFSNIPILEKHGNWARIFYCGVEGWVADAYLEEQEKTSTRIQVCKEGLFDPFLTAKLVDPVDSINLDESLTVGDGLEIDDGNLNRKLGQAMLSSAYVVCIEDARGDEDAQNKCIKREHEYWAEDMSRAFNLVSAILTVDNMKLLRDSQRVWQEFVEAECDEKGFHEAKPFTRYHVPTCRLKLTFSRSIDLENLLKQDTVDFQKKLDLLDRKTGTLFANGGKAD